MSTTMINGVEVDTTECDKKSAAVEQGSQEIGEFLDWMREQGLHICRWREDLTDTRTCSGLNRHGGVAGLFEPSNCDGGKVARHSVDAEGGRVYYVGDECPRCDGAGYLEVEAGSQFVEEHGGIERLLADYFEVDLAKMDKEQAAMLAALRGEKV